MHYDDGVYRIPAGSVVLLPWLVNKSSSNFLTVRDYSSSGRPTGGLNSIGLEMDGRVEVAPCRTLA